MCGCIQSRGVCVCVWSQDLLMLSEADIRDLGVRNGAHRARIVSSLVMLREAQQRQGKMHALLS